MFDLSQKDVYFTEEYIRLYENPSKKEKSICFVAQEKGKCMLFPYLERCFEYFGNTYKDFETVYGYGGPIYNTVDQNFHTQSSKEMFNLLKSQNYVAGFIRFHPLLKNYQGFAVGKDIYDRNTVALDISLSEDDIWANEIHTKNRNVIKKGEKNGLKFYADYDFIFLDDFKLLYNKTMDKLSADDFYYFGDQYYNNFKKNITNSFIGIVKKDDKVISAAIFMYEGKYAHYHLSGSDRNYLLLQPNNFMLYKAALELKKCGAEIFHLGGGTTSDENDSLLCFKKKFSKHLYEFHIGKIVFNEGLYESICQDWAQKNPDKDEKYKCFLLKYKY
jgi:Uncharacterized protein involved in methicillin resistance